MIRPLGSLATVAAVTGGTCLTVPTVAAGQKAPHGNSSREVDCNVGTDNMGDFLADHWWDTRKRGVLEWWDSTDPTAPESLLVRDKNIGRRQGDGRCGLVPRRKAAQSMGATARSVRWLQPSTRGQRSRRHDSAPQTIRGKCRLRAKNARYSLIRLSLFSQPNHREYL